MKRSMQPATNLLTRRYEQLVTVFTNYYMTHPDAEVFVADRRAVLAKCMATKVAYGVTYEDDVELTLRRLNQWRSAIPQEESE